jgi:hypothetical protein
MEWPQVEVSGAVAMGVVVFDLASDTPDLAFAPAFYAIFVALGLISRTSGNASRR